MAESQEVVSQQGSEDLQSMYASYKERKEVKKFLTKEEKLAKYFNPRRDKEYFRALPASNNDSKIPLIDRIFQQAYFHEVKIGKDWKKVYCPAHNDPKIQALDKDNKPVFDQNNKPVMVSVPCPLCKKSKVHLATQDRSIQAKVKGKKKEEIEKILSSDELKIYNKNKEIFSESTRMEAKKFYILRGIDRGAEKDGVKFWRIKHSFKNKGVFDIIMSVTEEYGLQHGFFTDINKGTDFTIIVGDTTMPGKTYSYKEVSAIIARGPSKLHPTDPMIEKQWLSDKTEWREVFKASIAPHITTHQFLELAAEGNAPYFDMTDSNNKRWVFPNHLDLELAANTRTQNLDAPDEYDSYDDEGTSSAATSVVNDTYKTDITTITDQDVKKFNHDSQQLAGSVSEPVESSDSEYGDLPF